MLTDEESRWLEQASPIWLGSPLQLGSTTQRLGDSMRIGNVIELAALLDLIERKFQQIEADSSNTRQVDVLNAITERLVDPADKTAYIAAANEKFIGE